MTPHPPTSTRLTKGALVTLSLTNPLRSLIVFQYNPETVTRKVDARAAGGGGGGDQGDRTEALRLKAPPKETISIPVGIDSLFATMGESDTGYALEPFRLGVKA